jgi:hypothetical protein
MHPLSPFARALGRRGARYVLIGVSGANLYGPAGQAVFATEDFDLFLQPDARNLVNGWLACDDVGLDVWLNDEPLDRPRDEWLANRVIERRAAMRGTGPDDLVVDLTLEMAGYDFEAVWSDRREFVIDDANIPVARLLHIVTSKHAAGRDKDRLFLATHKDALEQLLKKLERD